VTENGTADITKPCTKRGAGAHNWAGIEQVEADGLAGARTAPSRLASTSQSWPDDAAGYKARGGWWSVLLAYLALLSWNY